MKRLDDPSGVRLGEVTGRTAGLTGAGSWSHHAWRTLTALFGAVVLLVTGLLTAGSPAQATTGVNDYPYAGSTPDQVDQWDFYTDECTSFVAWRINNDAHVAFTNHYGGVTWGNAGNWAAAAQQAGVPENSDPTVGSVAVFPGGVDGAGSLGHVAWVVGVESGIVTVEDYNWLDSGDNDTSYEYSQHTVSSSGLTFIHFAGVGTVGSPETWINPSSGEYLDLDHSDSANGTKIQIWSWDNTEAQWWIRKDGSGGWYELTSKKTGSCVGVMDASTANGAKVIEWDCNGNPDQRWRWNSTGQTVDGWPVYKIQNKNSGLCLDVTAAGTADGTPLQQWGCGGGTNQDWY